MAMDEFGTELDGKGNARVLVLEHSPSHAIPGFQHEEGAASRLQFACGREPRRAASHDRDIDDAHPPTLNEMGEGMHHGGLSWCGGIARVRRS